MDLALDQALLDTAAAWLARHDAGLSPAAEAEFQQWLAADPGHARAWAEVCAPWEKLDEARADGMADWMLIELGRRERLRDRRRLLVRWGSLAAAAVALMTWVTLRLAAPQVPVTEREPEPVLVAGSASEPAPTATAVILRPEQRVLEDGTVVELKGDALLSVAFTGKRRVVRLISGTAHFEVFHDASRPFIVRAGAVTVRAVGTALAVERTDEAADVLVTEGRVGVARAESEIDPPDPLLVGAGGRVLMSYDPADGIPPVEILSPAEIASRLQWRVPRLQLRGASLVQVVEMLNGLNRVQLRIADPALEQLRFSGLFRADNAAGFVSMLQGNYGVKVSYDENETIILSRR
ncbi:MAG: FecR family protein [Cephaloticoccus sp.]